MSAPASPGRVILIGFMGSGKTSVGRVLASRLGWEFVDTDALIEAREGSTVSEIFRVRGEPAFRELEREVLESLRERTHVVIASGGGAPAQENNASFFASSEAAVFHLQVSLETALQRAGGNQDRPLLARGRESVHALYESRLPLYKSMGRGVQTERRAPGAIAEDILDLLKNPRRSPAPGDSGPQAP